MLWAHHWHFHQQGNKQENVFSCVVPGLSSDMSHVISGVFPGILLGDQEVPRSQKKGFAKTETQPKAKRVKQRISGKHPAQKPESHENKAPQKAKGLAKAANSKGSGLTKRRELSQRVSGKQKVP